MMQKDESGLRFSNSRTDCNHFLIRSPPQKSSDVHLEEDGMGKCLMLMVKNECKK